VVRTSPTHQSWVAWCVVVHALVLGADDLTGARPPTRAPRSDRARPTHLNYQTTLEKALAFTAPPTDRPVGKKLPRQGFVDRPVGRQTIDASRK
jgi:hypothetical protein